MIENEKFIEEYVAWSTQEKYKDFSFITKLSKTKQEELINASFVNVWAFLFGPFYYIYLRMYRGILFFIISLFFFTLGFEKGLILYLILCVILSLFANKTYLAFLKRKKEEYAHFEPDAKTPYFNISNKRLFILSMLTGGIYLMYWMYRNAKAMKDAQKDIIHPFWQAVFMSFTSMNVFRAVTYSVKKLNYPQKLNPATSAWLFFFLIAGYGFDYKGDPNEAISLHIMSFLVVLYWSLLLLSTLLILKYQKAIHFYCNEKEIEQITKATVWEIILVFIGCLLNAGLIFSTGLVISMWI